METSQKNLDATTATGPCTSPAVGGWERMPPYTPSYLKPWSTLSHMECPDQDDIRSHPYRYFSLHDGTELTFYGAQCYLRSSLGSMQTWMAQFSSDEKFQPSDVLRIVRK